MANVYVGFHYQRSCNRILKPPGGGSSNIFGTDRVLEVDSPKNIDNSDSVQTSFQTATIVATKSVTDHNGTTYTETSKESKTEQSEMKTDENGMSQTNGHTDHAISRDVNVINGTEKNDVKEVTKKAENLSIQEGKHEDVEIDSSSVESQSQVKTVITSKVEVKSSRTSTNSSIADVLNQDGVAVKDVDVPRKEKPKTPNRVPPGGFSSGLW